VRAFRANALRSVVCLGAHCDDVEIGCGATVRELVRRNPDLHVHWVVFSSDERRAVEARASAAAFLEAASRWTIDVHEFRGRFFPFVGAEIKDEFDELGRRFQPDAVFTHCRDDLHQDHRLIADLAYNTFRSTTVFEYEIPKFDGDLGRPNVFVPVTAAEAERKADLLLEHFPSQHGRHWFTRDTFLALMRLRGVESKAPEGYAEAFHCRKLVLS
jgi:LmbE family N-acetylglucosaminyl deacetylase